MAVKCLAVGRNMPSWVKEAFSDYNKRLPPEFALELIEIRPEHRSKESPSRGKPTHPPEESLKHHESYSQSPERSRHHERSVAIQKLSSATLQTIEKEGQKILAAIPPQHLVIALDERGQAWNTLQLAKQLKNWREEQSKICLIIGGPDGLSDAVRQRANYIWSLSPLTLPHPLVRVIIAEQIYRAWSIMTNHPYHRA